MSNPNISEEREARQLLEELLKDGRTYKWSGSVSVYLAWRGGRLAVVREVKDLARTAKN